MGWLTGQIPRGPDKGESHTLTRSFPVDLQRVPRTAWSGMWVGIARDFLRYTRSSVVCEEKNQPPDLAPSAKWWSPSVLPWSKQGANPVFMGLSAQ